MAKLKTQFLEPLFQNIPPQLRERPAWVVWKGDKRPYKAIQAPTYASPTDPSTWSSYGAAKDRYALGGMLGIGTVLNGDGIAAIDLDDCVINGKPNDEAIALLTALQVGYCELSPSGTGLHAWVKSSVKQAHKGFVGNLSIEFYPSARYLTVTGHAIQSGELTFCPRIPEVVDKISKRRKRGIESGSSVTSGTSVSSVEFIAMHGLGYKIEVPLSLIPSEQGCRNHTIFELARFLKGIEPDASPSYFKPLLLEWFELAKPYIRTQTFDTSWTDFYIAFENVKYPEGQIFNLVANNLPTLPKDTLGWDMFGSLGNQLLRLCHGLQAHQGDLPFFLSSRKAGEFLGVDHTIAAKLIKAFRLAKILIVVEDWTRSKAARFRLNNGIDK